MLHIRVRKKNLITNSSRIRDTIFCAFIPESVGAYSVRLRLETTRSCYSLKAAKKNAVKNRAGT